MQNCKDTAAEAQTNRNMKNCNIERQKPSFNKRIGGKCRLVLNKSRTEQNNDHTGIIHNIQFRSSFNNKDKQFKDGMR